MARLIIAIAAVISTSPARAAILTFANPAPSPIDQWLPVHTTLTENSGVSIEAQADPGYRNVTTGFWIRRDVASWINVWADAFICTINLSPYAGDSQLDLEIGHYYNGQGTTASYRVVRFNGGPLVIATGGRIPEPASGVLAVAAGVALAVLRRHAFSLRSSCFCSAR